MVCRARHGLASDENSRRRGSSQVSEHRLTRHCSPRVSDSCPSCHCRRSLLHRYHNNNHNLSCCHSCSSQFRRRRRTTTTTMALMAMQRQEINSRILSNRAKRRNTKRIILYGCFRLYSVRYFFSGVKRLGCKYASS